MVVGIKLFVYPVTDLERSKAQFAKFLGVDPYADSPYYVGFRVGDQEIGLDPNGASAGLTSPVDYWRVDDIAKSVEEFLAAGAATRQGIRDVGEGKLVALLADSDANLIGLVQEPFLGKIAG